MFITAHRQGIWAKDSDFSRRYYCHVAWFAGPKEKFSDPYDVHHTLRRRLEITPEVDGVCNPFGFKVTNYENVVKTIHVGLERDDLVRGVSEVMRESPVQGTAWHPCDSAVPPMNLFKACEY